MVKFVNGFFYDFRRESESDCCHQSPLIRKQDLILSQMPLVTAAAAAEGSERKTICHISSSTQHQLTSNEFPQRKTKKHEKEREISLLFPFWKQATQVFVSCLEPLKSQSGHANIIITARDYFLLARAGRALPESREEKIEKSSSLCPGLDCMRERLSSKGIKRRKGGGLPCNLVPPPPFSPHIQPKEKERSLLLY